MPRCRHCEEEIIPAQVEDPDDPQEWIRADTHQYVCLVSDDALHAPEVVN